MLGERVRHRLGDERLAAPRRPVQQHALRRVQVVVAVQVGVEERQLHRVADLADLGLEPADVVEGDVRDFLQGQLGKISLFHHLHRYPGLQVSQHGVACANIGADLPGNRKDVFLPARGGDDDAAIIQALRNRGQLAAWGIAAGLYHDVPLA